MNFQLKRKLQLYFLMDLVNLKREVEIARRQFKKGEYYTEEEVYKKFS